MSPHAQIVKTKADIVVQENVMKSVIEYIRMFSDDFVTQLQTLRSQESLLSCCKERLLAVDEE